jgi:hypothetical protein
MGKNRFYSSYGSFGFLFRLRRTPLHRSGYGGRGGLTAKMSLPRIGRGLLFNNLGIQHLDFSLSMHLTSLSPSSDYIMAYNFIQTTVISNYFCNRCPHGASA